MGLLYDYLPQWAAEFGIWTSMVTKIVGAVTSIAGPLLIGGRALWKLNTVVFPSMGVKTISNNTGGGNVKGGKGGGLAKGAIYGAIGVAMAALGTYLVNKSVESQKQRADQHKRNAITLQRQNLSRYGINHDFTGEQTGELVKQNAAKLGAEWKDTGNKIAMAIDAVAIGLSGVTGGLSLLAIPIAHLGAWATGEAKQAYERGNFDEMRVKTGTAFNKNGEFDKQFNAKIDEYLKPFIDALSDVNNPIFQWSEKERKSLLRSALQAKKALFSVDYIVKGKLTQFAQLQTKAALSNLKQIQMMGGDNKSVASNMSILARESTKAFTTQMRLLNQQKTDIFNNNQMDSATKAVVLDEVKKQEIEIYQRFNESLQAIVNNMMELPSILINDAKLAMRQNMGNFFNKNFGLGGASFDESSEVGDMVVSNMAQAIKANSHAVEELTEAHRQAQQAVKNNTQALEKVKKQTGMNESQADAILKERDRRNEQAFKDDKEAMAVLQQAKEIHESIHKVIEKGDEASAKDKEAAKNSQQQLISLYEGLKKNPELMGRMGLDEKQIDEILSYVKSIDVTDAKNRKKILQDAANGNRGAAVIVGVLQALLKASEKNRFTDYQKQQHQSAEKVKTAQMMASGARGSEVSAAKKLEEANKKFIAKIEQEQNYFINSLKQSFNDGAKRFQQALVNYYDRSWEFNQYGSGNANLENMLYANSDLLKTMQDNYAQNKITAEDTLTKALADVTTLMSQPQQDPEVIEYLAKYKKMLEYQTKALANPQDATSVALAKNAVEQLKLMEETNRNVADFKKQNQDKLVSATAIAGSYTQLLEERIAIEQQQMKLINKIGNAIELRLSAIQNKIPRQTAELYASYAQYGELIGDYKGAALYGRAAIDTTAFSVAKDNADAQATREKALDDARRHYQQNIDSGMDKEKALNILRDETLKIEKQFIDTRKNGITRITKQIQQAFKIQQDHIKRIEQGIDIQRDVANAIGAPFETILELEQRRVDLAREQLESAEEELKTMEEKGITGKALEEQKLKVSQAQAEVIKRAWGAQRDALDKMLGKVMGTFQQIGGIFGPNGARMQARKYGQGYGVTPGGQIERAIQGYGGRQNVMHGRMRGQGYIPPLYASGGEIPGHSTSGDKVMAFVNSGEWILNPRQMNKLADTLGLKDAEDVFDISNGKKFAKGGRIGKFKKYSMSIEEAKAGKFSRAEDYMTDEEQAENEKAKNKLKGVEMQGSEAGNKGVQNDKGVSVDKNTGMAKVENTNADDSGDYIKKIYKNTSEMLKLAKGQATSEDTGREELYVKEMTKKLNELRENGASAEEIGIAENDLADAKFRLLEKQEKIKPKWGEVIYYEQEILKVLKGSSLGTTNGGYGYRAITNGYINGMNNRTSQNITHRDYIPPLQHPDAFNVAKLSDKQSIMLNRNADDLPYLDEMRKMFDNFPGAPKWVSNISAGFGGNLLRTLPKDVQTRFQRIARLREIGKSGKHDIGVYKRMVRGGGKPSNININSQGVKNGLTFSVRNSPGSGAYSIKEPSFFTIADKGGRTSIPKGAKIDHFVSGKGGGTKFQVRMPNGRYGNHFTVTPRTTPNISVVGKPMSIGRGFSVSPSSTNVGIKPPSRFKFRMPKFNMPKLNLTVGRITKALGVIGTVLTIADGVITHIKADAMEKAGFERDAGRERAKFWGRTIGGFTLGAVGGAVGSLAGPGGTLLGGAGGGYVGANIGEKVFEKIYDWFSDAKNTAEIKRNEAMNKYNADSAKFWDEKGNDKNFVGNFNGAIFSSKKELDDLRGKILAEELDKADEDEQRRVRQHNDNRNWWDKTWGTGKTQENLNEVRYNANVATNKRMEEEIKRRQEQWQKSLDATKAIFSEFNTSVKGVVDSVQQENKNAWEAFEKRQQLRENELKQLDAQYRKAKSPQEKARLEARAKELGEQNKADYEATAQVIKRNNDRIEKQSSRMYQYTYEGGNSIIGTQEQLKKAQTAAGGKGKLREIQIDSYLNDRGVVETKLAQDRSNIISVNRDKWKLKQGGKSFDYSQSVGGRKRAMYDRNTGKTVLLDMEEQEDLKRFHDLQQENIKNRDTKALQRAYEEEREKRQANINAQIERIQGYVNQGRAYPRMMERLKRLQEQKEAMRKGMDAGDHNVGYYRSVKTGKQMLYGSDEYKAAVKSGEQLVMTHKYRPQDDIMRVSKGRYETDMKRAVDDTLIDENGRIMHREDIVDDEGNFMSMQDLKKEYAQIEKELGRGYMDGQDKFWERANRRSQLQELMKKLKTGQAKTKKDFEAEAKSGKNFYGIVKDEDTGKQMEMGSKEYEEAKAQGHTFTNVKQYNPVVGKSPTGESAQSTGKKGHGESESAKSSGYIPPSQDKSAGPKQSTARSVMRRNRGIDFSSPKADASPVAQRGKSGDVKSDVKDAQAQTQVAFGAHVDRFGSAVDRLVAVLPNNGDVKNPSVQNNQQVNPNDKASGGNTQNSTTSGGNISTNGSNGETPQSKPQNNEVSGKLNVTVDVRFNTAMFEQAVKRIVLTYASNIVQKGGNQAGSTS